MIPSIETIRQSSGAKYFASLFGKSTIEHNGTDYKIIKDVTRVLLEKGYGVIHGGYAGGAMEAVNESALEFIRSEHKSPCLNIAVPHVGFDSKWNRVTGATFTEAAEDIFDRLRIINSGDIMVVLPKGGWGTQLELTLAIHENQIAESLGGKIKPIIFVSSEIGTKWEDLLKYTIEHLDLPDQSVDKTWIYFVNSAKELGEIVDKINLT